MKQKKPLNLNPFVLIFAVIWGVQFAIGKRNVKKMNEKISEEKQN